MRFIASHLLEFFDGYLEISQKRGLASGFDRELKKEVMFLWTIPSV